jgi:hypothetical protein
MSDRLPIVPLPPQAAPEATAPPPGWWRDGFLWRLKWGAEGRVLRNDGKRAKAVMALARSPRFQRFAEYLFAVDAEGRCRFAVRPTFHSGLGIEIRIWAAPLPYELRVSVQRGSYRKRRAVLGVELLDAEQVKQIDAAASFVLGAIWAHYERETRLVVGAPLDLADPGDEVHVARQASSRARERGIGVRELAHAKAVAGKSLGVSKDTYLNWPDEHGRQDWSKLVPRIGAVRQLTELVTGTQITEDEVKAVWTAAEQIPPFHPLHWPNSKA